MPLKTTSITIKCIVMDFYQVLEKRRTIRDFSNKEVTDEVLEKVLSAAFKAPTNDHLRQFEFIVVRGQENIARLISPVAENTKTIQQTQLKAAENVGYIKKYIAVLDAEKLNQGFVVFCSVKLRRLNRDIAAEFTRIIQDIPEVTECYNISGSYDYLLKIHAPNMKYYQEFILNILGTIDSLGSLESTFVMAEVKHRYGIHI